ncbi:MAG: HEPN domain-containing protein [Candidatus Bathyarchaeia archaeon]
MKSIEMGRAMLQQSYQRLKTAKRALEERVYAYTVRAAQECVELSLKAALRVMGIEYPKKHDVSRVLRKTKNRFPKWFDVGGYASISRELSEKRGLAVYGDELRMIPATILFDEEEAKKAYGEAARVYEACEKLIKAIEAP